MKQSAPRENIVRLIKLAFDLKWKSREAIQHTTIGEFEIDCNTERNNKTETYRQETMSPFAGDSYETCKTRRDRVHRARLESFFHRFLMLIAAPVWFIRGAERNAERIEEEREEKWDERGIEWHDKYLSMR